MGDRCTGHCCREFTLPVSPDELATRAKDNPYDLEVQKIAGMVVHLKTVSVAELGDANPQDWRGIHPAEMRGAQHWYTCTIYDKTTGNCGDYDQRPRMCRDYPGNSEPYGIERMRACRYKACTWDKARFADCGIDVRREWALRNLGPPSPQRSLDQLTIGRYPA